MNIQYCYCAKRLLRPWAQKNPTAESVRPFVRSFVRVLTVRWIFLENFQEMPGFEQIRFFQIFETNILSFGAFLNPWQLKEKIIIYQSFPVSKKAIEIHETALQIQQKGSKSCSFCNIETFIVKTHSPSCQDFARTSVCRIIMCVDFNCNTRLCRYTLRFRILLF